MKATDFKELLTKKMLQELTRLLGNKNKTVKSFSVEKNEQKTVFKVSFKLSHPMSSNSSVLIIIRSDAAIDRWVSIYDNTPPKQEEKIVFSKDILESLAEDKMKEIVKQLLKEII